MQHISVSLMWLQSSLYCEMPKAPGDAHANIIFFTSVSFMLLVCSSDMTLQMPSADS